MISQIKGHFLAVYLVAIFLQTGLRGDGVTVQNIIQNDFCWLHLLSVAPANGRIRHNTKSE